MQRTRIEGVSAQASSKDEAVVLGLLETAKKIHEEKPGSAQPFAFLFHKKDGLDAMGVIALGGVDMSSGDDKDGAAALIRKAARDVEAHLVAFLSDSWVTRFADVPAIEAAGLDVLEYRSWSEEDRARFMVRREALLLSIESHDSPPRQLWQFYRLEGGRIVWEEQTDNRNYQAEGRFTNLLPPKKGRRQ